MSVDMWNCHSWPLDVSNNLSGYFISNLVLVTSCDSTGGPIWLLYICMVLNVAVGVVVCKPSVLAWLGGTICIWYLYVHLSLYILISWLFQMGEGVIWLWYLYVHWSLYIHISWLFQMGEGVIWLWYLYVHWSLYILISWLFQMGEGVIWLWYLYVHWSLYI